MDIFLNINSPKSVGSECGAKHRKVQNYFVINCVVNKVTNSSNPLLFILWCRRMDYDLHLFRILFNLNHFLCNGRIFIDLFLFLLLNFRNVIVHNLLPYQFFYLIEFANLVIIFEFKLLGNFPLSCLNYKVLYHFAIKRTCIYLVNWICLNTSKVIISAFLLFLLSMAVIIIYKGIVCIIVINIWVSFFVFTTHLAMVFKRTLQYLLL